MEQKAVNENEVVSIVDGANKENKKPKKKFSVNFLRSLPLYAMIAIPFVLIYPLIFPNFSKVFPFFLKGSLTPLRDQESLQDQDAPPELRCGRRGISYCSRR